MLNEIHTMPVCDPPSSPDWPALSSSSLSQPTIQEMISMRIVHFFYNLTRKEDVAELNEMSNLFSEIFRSLKYSYQHGELPRKDYLEFLGILFKMVIQTRDFEMGKGERDLAYMMIYVWYQHYPLISILLIRLMVGRINLSEFGYEQEYGCFGSWKDIVALCQYVYEQPTSSSLAGVGIASTTGLNYSKPFHPLVESAIEIAIQQLEVDVRAAEVGEKLSFVAKWIPRENSASGRLLYDRFVYHWIQKKQPWILQTADNYTRMIYAWNKSRRIFRKVLSHLNQALDTTEIKMCSQNWSAISPEKINFLTFIRSRDAFLNLSKKRGGSDGDESSDRELCSQQVKQHFYSNKIFQRVKYKNEVKSHPYDSGIRTFSSPVFPVKTLPFGYGEGAIQDSSLPDVHVNEIDGKEWNAKRSKTSKLRNYPLSLYVKRAFELISLSSAASSPNPWIQTQIATLNQQWRYNLSFHIDLNFTIPIVDVPLLSENLKYATCSMETLYQMIGVACFLSEKSTLDKRMLFLVHHRPVWLNLSHCMDFFSMIQEIYTVLPSMEECVPLSDVCSPSHSEGVVQSVEMILESIRNVHMSEETSEKMIWVFLQNWGEDTYAMIQKIDQQCSQFCPMGKSVSSPPKTPHIVYWNFCSKTISPFSSQKSLKSMNTPPGLTCLKSKGVEPLLKERTTFFSGFSTSFIDYLCFMGIFNIRDSSPYQTICQLFQHPHYDVYEKIFRKIIS